MAHHSTKLAKLRSALKAAVGVMPLAALTLNTQPVYAQLSANNVVSACSGVSLPPSVVTDILKPVITGIAAPLETRVNSVTGLLGALVGSPTPLTLGTTNLLNTAASGAPITLQVLNTNGQVVSNSNPCYSQAEGFTLKNPAGLALGGNQLTGLGSGQIAVAGEVNSIAFGNNAQTAATALGSIALGTNSSVGTGAIGSIAFGTGAQATAANSIALGAGSTASRGGQTYTGFALSSPTTSVGEFSVGTAGSVRQITNVAPGSSATDAVNVAQLQSVSNAVTTVGNSLTTLGNTVTALDGVAIKYDGTNRLTATLGGVGGTTLTNVKAGAVTASSTDAVNGGQLFTTNTNVANVNSALTTLDGAAIKYDGINHQLATLGGVGGTTLTNVKAGAVTGSSTDAVNGSQLFATNNNVAANTSAITTNSTAIVSLTNQVTNAAIGAVRYSNAGTPTIPNGGTGSQDLTLVGGAAGSVKLHNVGDGVVTVGSTDAVNGGQLAATNAAVTTNSNAITTLNSTVSGQGTLITNNNNAILALRNDATNGAIGTVQFSSTLAPTVSNGGVPSQDMALIGGTAGAAVRLHNVANGNVAAGSTDAVNGGQLATTNSAVSTNSSQIATLNTTVAGQNVQIGANTTAITNNATAITNVRNDTINGAIGVLQYSNAGTPLTPNGGTRTQDVTLVGGAAGSVKVHNVADGSISAGSTDAVNGGQIYTLSNGLGTISNLAVQYDDLTHSRITLGGVGGASVALGNVSAGILNGTSTDAVNGSQLFATNQNVTANTSSINGLTSSVTLNSNAITALRNDTATGAIGTVQFSSSGTPLVPNGGTPSQDMVLVGGGAGSVRLHNVASGNIAAGSTDAVNGGQIFALNNTVGNLSNLAVQYDDGTHASITFGGVGSPAVALHNVGNGTIGAGSTDAVNGSQLFATNQNVTANTSAINTLNSSVNLNNNAIIALRNDTNNGAVGPWRYSNPGTPTTPNGGTPTNDAVIVGGSAGAVRLHNVANGTVAAGSTDVVNGGQLFALSNTLTSVDQLAIRYDDASHLRATLGGIGNPAVTLDNVSDGTLNANSLEAVNGRQLFATNTAVSNLRTDVDNTTQALTAVGNQVFANNTNITLIGSQLGQLELGISNGSVGPVQYSSAQSPTTPSGAPSQDLTLVGASQGPVSLHNVANGLVGSGSSDAINGGQLFGVGSGLASLLGFTYNPLTNSFAGSLSYGGNQYGNVQNVFDQIYTDLAGSGGSTSNTASKYFHTTSLLADSEATGADATAIGPNAEASGEAAIASGRNATASGEGSVAIGDGATAQDGKAVSIGFGNVASGNGSVAIGDPNFATGEGAIALGKDNTATGDGAVSLGNTNSATGLGAIAVGNNNLADGEGAIAIGDRNQTTGEGAFAVGDENIVNGDFALAIGSRNSAIGDGALAIGSGVNISAADAVAIGEDALVTATDSVAMGNRSTATGISSTAVGNDTVASDVESSAFGDAAMATGQRSTALGSSATASGGLSLAVGESSQATGFGSTSLGLLSTASGYASTALGSGSIALHEASVALGSAAETTRGAQSNYGAFGLDALQTSQGEIAVARNIVYTDPITGLNTPIGTRQITGVAAGSLATDAVNVSQLSGAAANLGNAFASSIGGGASYNAATGKLNVPGFIYNGATYASINDALAAVGTQGGAGGGNSPVYDNSNQSSVTLGGTDGTTVHNVAEGSVTPGSTDAVNGGQLAETNARVAQVENGAAGTVQYANASTPTVANGGTKTNDVTLVGAQAAPVALHNVADGQVAAGSTDAVNGGQLAATNVRVAAAEDTANAAMTIQSRSVRYDSDTQDALTLGSAGGPAVALHNVAEGVSGTDAVNVSQMNAGVESAVQQANDYTDSRLAAISFDLKKVSRNANAGSAAALAAAGMPQSYEAGKGMLAMGAGTYGGQSAVAVGFSKASENGRWVIKAGATYNSRGKVGANAGIGFQL